MISSNTQKFLLIALFALLLNASCRLFQSTPPTNKIQDTESEIQTNIPFSTKEPETFQAEFVTETFINGEKSERKNFVAKKGEKLLATYGFETNEEVSYLVRSADEPFIINHSEKTIQKRNPIVAGGRDLLQNDWQQFLTSKWLNEKQSASFEKLEDENGLTKYRVNLENKNNSDILIFIDEKIQMPVKQEFYSIVENKNILNYSVEMKNFKTEVDDKLFELPKDYKQIN